MKQQRVGNLKGPLAAAIQAFDNGTQKEGVQAFQKKILDSIRKSELCTQQTVHAKHAAVHRENRDECGLAPADVHDLMQILAEVGWDNDQCSSALAVEIHVVYAMTSRRLQLES